MTRKIALTVASVLFWISLGITAAVLFPTSKTLVIILVCVGSFATTFYILNK